MKTRLLLTFGIILVLNLTVFSQCPGTPPMGYTCIPDSNFEQALIDFSIDSEGTLDGQVLTNDINTVTFLDVNLKSISDLTGIEDFTALEQLNCHLNNLTSLNLSSNSNLRVLLCYNNQLQNTLDLTANGALESVICNNNQLTGINLPSTMTLTRVDCHFNDLTTVDVTMAPNLDRLNITQNAIPSINLSNNTKLTEFFGVLTGLQGALDLSANVLLERVDCDRNSLTGLMLPTTDTLTELRCWNNSLTSLDAQGLTEIQYLDCCCNDIQTLLLPNTTTLTQLWACCNQLSNLDFTNNTGLQRFDIGINNFTSLDISMLTALERFWCNDNNLNYLNAKNTSNDILDYFYADTNPSLTCIQVDVAPPLNTTNWTKPAGASYSTSCPALSTEEFLKEPISLYPNPINSFFNVKLETEASYSLINILGKVITKGNLISGENQLDISHVSNGIYYLQIKNAEGSLTKKIVKE